MTDIKALIQKQAEAVKNKSAQILAAEHLEQAAKLLRSEAGPEPVKFSFRQAYQEKKQRGQSFMDAHFANKAKEVDKLLKDSSWVQISKTDTTTSYGNKTKPGLRLTITGNKFKVLDSEGKVVQTETELNFLKDYLTKPVTNKM